MVCSKLDAEVANHWETFKLWDERIKEAYNEALANVWAIYAGGEMYGIDVPVLPWELTYWKDFRKLEKITDAIFARWCEEGEEIGLDNWEEEDMARGILEEEIERLEYGRAETEKFVKNITALHVQGLEQRDFLTLGYIMQGKVYGGFYRVKNWKDFVKELALLIYYQRLAKKMNVAKNKQIQGKTPVTPDVSEMKKGAETENKTQNEEGAGTTAEECMPEKFCISATVKKMYEFGYFNEKIAAGMPEVHIAKEIAQVLGTSANYARKVFREVTGSNCGRKGR